MTANGGFVLVIGTFGFRICLGFPASDFEFPGQAEVLKAKNLLGSGLSGLVAHQRFTFFAEAFLETGRAQRVLPGIQRSDDKIGDALSRLRG